MIFVLLPAYNEEASLSALLPKLHAALSEQPGGYRIIVCNDGSSDRTQEILVEYARSLPLEILRHKMNRGLGETIRDLFEHAAENSRPGDVLVRMDCDDTHEPEAIGAMLEKLGQGYDVVVASRFEPGGGQQGLSVYRALISRAANLFMKVFFPIKGLKEYSCGFRAYRAEAIHLAMRYYENNFVQLKGVGFTCTLEKLIKLHLLGMRFAEIPFELRYDQKRSESKMVTSITTFGYFVLTVLYHWPWGGWRARAARRGPISISRTLPNRR